LLLQPWKAWITNFLQGILLLLNLPPNPFKMASLMIGLTELRANKLYMEHCNTLASLDSLIIGSWFRFTNGKNLKQLLRLLDVL
jgi:hypothetical protein